MWKQCTQLSLCALLLAGKPLFSIVSYQCSASVFPERSRETMTTLRLVKLWLRGTWDVKPSCAMRPLAQVTTALSQPPSPSLS